VVAAQRIDMAMDEASCESSVFKHNLFLWFFQSTILITLNSSNVLEKLIFRVIFWDYLQTTYSSFFGS
jgi:hypothetical protein